MATYLIIYGAIVSARGRLMHMNRPCRRLFIFHIKRGELAAMCVYKVCRNVRCNLLVNF